VEDEVESGCEARQRKLSPAVHLSSADDGLSA
jgi:hypothetical protein